jgi:hypothetical protein
MTKLAGTKFTLGEDFRVTNRQVIELSTSATSSVSVRDYGARGDGVTDDTAAIQAAVAASKKLFFPAGRYRLTSSITISGVNGLVLEGAGASLEAGGVTYEDNAVLVFDGAPIGSDGLVISGFVGVTLKNLVISQRRGGIGGGRALYLHTGHDFVLESVKVDSATGSVGKGIVLGGGSGATAAFLGVIRNCKVFAQGGAAFEAAATNTTLLFDCCYQVGGKFLLDGITYSTFNSCASELSPDYGYELKGCTNLTFNSCGGEGNAKGVFYTSTTTSNCVFNAPYGAANNTSADAAIGDLFQIDSAGGACTSLVINTPTSVSTNGATAQSIYANAGNGFVWVNGVDSTLLAKGIGGNGAWLNTKLTRTGDGEVQSWTPTLTGWTNSGSPTLVGKYVKQGGIVTFYVKVTPGTNISATLSTSTIAGLPFEPVASNATMTDGNAVSYGVVVVSPAGIIYPQTSGTLTVPLTIAGQLFL